MNLKQLRARLAEIKKDMQALIDAGLDGESVAKFDSLESEAKEVQGNIDRLERFQDMQAEDEAPQGRQVAPSAPKARIEVRDNAQDDPTAGFSGLGEFALAVRSSNPHLGGSVDKRLNVLGAPSNFHREGGSSDGYMVPAQFKDKIFEVMLKEDEDLLSKVDSEPTSSNRVEFLSDETTPWGSTGIQAYWGAEGNQFTPSRLETEAQGMNLHKLHAFVTATEELIADAPRLNSRLTKGSARALNWKANVAIHEGTGAGQPLGFTNSAAQVVVAKEGSQAADTIVAKNVAKMYSRIMGAGRAIWLVNQDTLSELMTMTIGDQPIWLPPSAFMAAPGGVLLGRPVFFSEHCETLGDQGDIKLVNPMGYYVANKTGGTKFASSIHLYFDYDIQAFKWTMRMGGQPYLSAPVSPNKGSSTRSHFVTLAARA